MANLRESGGSNLWMTIDSLWILPSDQVKKKILISIETSLNRWSHRRRCRAHFHADAVDIYAQRN